MTSFTPFLSADQIRRATFVRHVEIHDSLDSTNNRAAEVAREPQVELPALVATRQQTAGRGRGANKWWSADGALTFSLLMEPATHGLATTHWPQLSLTTAVAICDALQAGSREHRAGSKNIPSTPCSLLPAPCSIKWPNDVLVDGRKIAGVLLESPGGPALAKDRLILGIGLNVNNSCQATPAAAHGLAPAAGAPANATALCDITGCQHDLQQLLVAILNSLATRIDELRTDDPTLPAAWQRLNHFAGHSIRIQSDRQVVVGQCVDIAADGALVVDTHDDRLRFYSGSVRSLRSILR